MSLKDTILSAKDTKLERVEVPEWGTTVWVKEMSGVERDRYEAAAFPGGKPREDGFTETILVFTLCDEQGNRIFGDGDVEQLRQKASPVLYRLNQIARRVNKLRREDVEEAAKNS